MVSLHKNYSEMKNYYETFMLAKRFYERDSRKYAYLLLEASELLLMTFNYEDKELMK